MIAMQVVATVKMTTISSNELSYTVDPPMSAPGKDRLGL
jgi:hypothetical protein